MVVDFVQIGANVGRDHVFARVAAGDFVVGLLVDANPECIPVLQECYKNYPGMGFEHAAVSNYDGKTTFYRPAGTDGDECHAWGSCSPSHIPTRPDFVKRAIAEVEVPCYTLESLFKKNGIKHAEWLFVDAEAYDFIILMNQLTDEFTVNNICYEYTNMSEANNDTLREYLKVKGFQFTHNEGENTYFSRV